MKLTTSVPRGLAKTRSLLDSLVAMPDLAPALRSLPPHAFAALVRRVGVEDAGELVALATTPQLVQAFDEDLFVAERAGDREALDSRRFAVWLEVLLEAGDAVAARRVAELDEDFVAHALAGMLLVLDEDALRQTLDDADEDEARQLDKELEGALSEDVDGYVLIAKQHEGWDAALSLILALDRDHRALLVRLLDRLAALGSGYLDDLDDLSEVLTEAESLAEDVEAARDGRRSAQGYVEPRAARAFLQLARGPREQGTDAEARDPLTRAYFRELGPTQPTRLWSTSPLTGGVRALPAEVQRALEEYDGGGASLAELGRSATAMAALVGALQDLSEAQPSVFVQRMEELAYLANVLVAGHQREGQRMPPGAAADAALATVGYGAALEARAALPARSRKGSLRLACTQAALGRALADHAADLLFRNASAALATGAAPALSGSRESGVLYSAEQLEAALA